MATFPNRPNAALLVIDVQNGVMADAHKRDTVVARIRGLIERARSAGVSVVWVQHESDDLVPGSDAWRYVPELVRANDEPLVGERYGDSFEATNLEEVLADRHVGRLVVAGAQTDACIRSTLHGAFTRGYDTILVTDAHTTSDLTEYGAPPPAQVIAHTNLYWRHQSAPGRTAGVVESAAVVFD